MQQRPEIPPHFREAASARALLDSCEASFSPWLRSYFRAINIEEADQRATAFANAPSNQAFWRERCPPGYVDGPHPGSRWERNKRAWETCDFSTTSPWRADELTAANFRAPVWDVRRVLVAGRIDVATAEIVAKDISTVVDYAPEPNVPQLALSTTHRRVDGPAVAIAATATADAFEGHFVAAQDVEVVVRRDEERRPWAGILIRRADAETGAVEVDVHRGSNVEPSAAIARASSSRPYLRLVVDRPSTWQQVVDTIDAHAETCGGWAPYLEADPAELGPGCPFAGFELAFVDRAWKDLKLVAGDVVVRKASPHAASVAGWIEDARGKIEDCMRRSRPFRVSETRTVRVSFLTNKSGKLAVFVTTKGDPGRRPPEPGDVPVDGCIQAALGFEWLEGVERAAHIFADVELRAEVP